MKPIRLGVKHVVHTTVVNGSSMIGFTIVIAESERDMPGIEPVPPGTRSSQLDTRREAISWPGIFRVPPTIALL